MKSIFGIDSSWIRGSLVHKRFERVLHAWSAGAVILLVLCWERTLVATGPARGGFKNTSRLGDLWVAWFRHSDAERIARMHPVRQVNLFCFRESFPHGQIAPTQFLN